MARRWAVGALVLGAMVGVACEPPPPPPVFQVTSLETGADAAPGDGLCETAPGNGICTTTAAVQEGNALGRAVIDVPEQSDLYAEPPLDVPVITGDITLRSTYTADNGAVGAWSNGGLRVDHGAVLRLEGFPLVVRGGMVVDGTVTVDRGALAATVDITEDGVLILVNSMVLETEVVPSGKSMINNDGTMIVRFSELWSTQPLVHTGPAARTIIGASVLNGPPDGCSGSPVASEGYNLDREYHATGEGCVAEDQVEVDAVPYGVLGCGTSVTVDNRNGPRPVDDDGDGDARCDIGLFEFDHG